MEFVREGMEAGEEEEEQKTLQSLFLPCRRRGMLMTIWR